MSYIKQQHELGLSGLALLRKWLIGDYKQVRNILKEVRLLTASFGNVPISQKKEISKYGILKGYQEWAPTYDKLPNLLIEIEEPIVKSLLKELPLGRALDAGCGTGRYSAYLNSLGHKVTGVDISPAMLYQARIHNPKIKFIESNLDNLPIKNSSIDLVTCALILTHFKNIGKAMKELSRVVKPKGHIVISDINPWFVALGAHADFRNEAGKWGYIANYVHWHSTYLQVFDRLDLKVLKCVEPTIKKRHIKLARKGFTLKAETVKAAIEGLPLALIWVLEKP